MKNNFYLMLFIVLMFISNNSYGQLDVAPGTFKVEAPKFSPPTQDLIHSFINKPAPQFQANDLHQQSKTISNYYGKSLLIFFWNTSEALSKEYLPFVNVLNDELSALKADLLTFGDESRSLLTAYVKENDISFTVIPNGAFLGDAIYGKELGTPRFFILDKKGIVRHIIPQEAAKDPVQTIAEIKAYLSDLMLNR